MRQLLALAALLALVLPGTAAAAYEEGSVLEVDAPGRLSGRVDALVEQGVASFVSPDGRVGLDASITAREVTLTLHSVLVCSLPSASCDLTGRSSQTESVTLRDATVRVTGPLQAYKLIVANDEKLSSPIVATTGGAETLLDATRQAMHLSPYNDGWSAEEPTALTEHVYTVPAGKPTVATRGGTLAAAGDLEVLFQGVEVEAKGTDANGKPYAKTFRAIRTSESSGTRTEFIVVDASSGVLRAASQADIAAYQVRALDLPRGRADFTGATGIVKTEAGDQRHERADVTLTGPLEILNPSVNSADPPRIAFALSSHLRVLDGAIPPETEDTTTGELVAAGAAGAGGAALLAAALYFWPRLKFALSALALPLYTRIQRTEVLEHDKRDEIYALIRDSPGIHAHEIGEKARIGWGTTVYHLKLLEQHNLIVSKKSGRYKRFFVNTGEYTKKKELYGALRNDTARAVMDFIAANPGASQKDLCGALGIQPSLASWHVQKLEAVELVKRVKDGRQVRYYAGPAWGDVAPTPRPSLGGGAAGGVADDFGAA